MIEGDRYFYKRPSLHVPPSKCAKSDASQMSGDTGPLGMRALDILEGQQSVPSVPEAQDYFQVKLERADSQLVPVISPIGHTTSPPWEELERVWRLSHGKGTLMPGTRVLIFTILAQENGDIMVRKPARILEIRKWDNSPTHLIWIAWYYDIPPSRGASKKRRRNRRTSRNTHVLSNEMDIFPWNVVDAYADDVVTSEDCRTVLDTTVQPWKVREPTHPNVQFLVTTLQRCPDPGPTVS